MIRIMQNVIKIIATLVLLTIITTAMFIYYYKRNNFDEPIAIAGYKAIEYFSESMNPGLQYGDLLISMYSSPEDIRVGDIITFRTSSNKLTARRVVGVILKNEKLNFVTRGDANIFVDEETVTMEMLDGIVMYRIPFGGSLKRFAESDKGFAIFIVIPIFLLVRGELKNMLADAGVTKLNDEDGMEIKI